MATLHVSRDPEEDESCLIFSDPAIKLFGRTIFLPNSTIATAADHFPGASPQPFGSNARVANTQSEFKFESDEDCLSPRGVDELGTTSGNSVGSDEEDLPSPSLSKESITDERGLAAVHAEGGQNGRGEVEKKEKPSLGSAQEKSLRKPDKVAPCPRCNSLDTKFCYFNNYNVNQPRHFCKCCQRYWTDGGTLRNVPVGAGRRKNKHGNQHKQPLPDAVFFRREEHEVAQPLLPCSLPQEVGWTSGVVKPICSAPVLHFPPSLESVYFTDSSPAQSALSASTQEIHFSGNMASQLTFGAAGAARGPSLPIYDSYRVVKVEVKSGESPQLRPKSLIDSSEVGNITEVTMTTVTDGKDDCVCSSTTSASETALNSDCDGGISTKPSLLCGAPFPPPPFFGMPWPYSYVSWAGAAAAGAGAGAGGDRSCSQGFFTSASQTETPASVGAAEGLWQWPHIPVAMWSPNGWNVPLTHPMAMAAVSAVPVASTSAAVKEISSGKRPRASSEGMDQGSLCIPKTLRIRDPGEAAQSSILTTLGVDGKSGSLLSTGFFTAFQPKAEVFQPNPGKRLPPQQEQMLANPPPPPPAAASSSSSIASHEGK